MTDTLPTRVPDPATPRTQRPTRSEAEAAVRVLLAWSGDDPDRPGLNETPQRVVESYDEYFSGYAEDPIATLQSAILEDVGAFDDVVMVKHIRFFSHCEHHLAPFSGVAHVAYCPDKHVTGIARIARLVDIFARRLTTQEALTENVLQALDRALQPQGSAIMVKAAHDCMRARSVQQTEAEIVTTKFSGSFKEQSDLQRRFLDMIAK